MEEFKDVVWVYVIVLFDAIIFFFIFFLTDYILAYKL